MSFFKKMMGGGITVYGLRHTDQGFKITKETYYGPRNSTGKYVIDSKGNPLDLEKYALGQPGGAEAFESMEDATREWQKRTSTMPKDLL
jgi:hypothetical protein